MKLPVVYKRQPRAKKPPQPRITAELLEKHYSFDRHHPSGPVAGLSDTLWKLGLPEGSADFYARAYFTRGMVEDPLVRARVWEKLCCALGAMIP